MVSPGPADLGPNASPEQEERVCALYWHLIAQKEKYKSTCKATRSLRAGVCCEHQTEKVGGQGGGVFMGAQG